MSEFTLFGLGESFIESVRNLARKMDRETYCCTDCGETTLGGAVWHLCPPVTPGSLHEPSGGSGL